MKNKIKVSEFYSFFMAVPALLWQLLFFYVPLLVIIFISFLKNKESLNIAFFTFENYKLLFDIIYLKIIMRSVVLAFLTTSFCLLLSYPIACYLSFCVKRFKNFLIFALVLPFFTNFLVQVYAWFFILEHNGLVNTILIKIGLISEPLHILNTNIAIFIVMVFCYLPYMVLPLYNGMEKVKHNLLEASSDLGATMWQTVNYIIFPLSFSGIKTGFFLVFILSYGEFVVPALLGGSKKMFVGNLISYVFLITKNMSLGGAFTCLSIVLLIIFMFIFEKILMMLFGSDKVKNEV